MGKALSPSLLLLTAMAGVVGLLWLPVTLAQPHYGWLVLEVPRAVRLFARAFWLADRRWDGCQLKM